jgi:hypothetical protein
MISLFCVDRFVGVALAENYGLSTLCSVDQPPFTIRHGGKILEALLGPTQPFEDVM